MSPEQTIALAVECGAEPSKLVEGIYFLTATDLQAFATRITQQAIAEHLAKQESAPVLPVVAYYAQGRHGYEAVNIKENKLMREFDHGEALAEPLCKVSDALAAIAAGGAK